MPSKYSFYYSLLTVFIRTISVFIVLKFAAKLYGAHGIVDYSNIQNIVIIFASLGACCNTAMIRFASQKDKDTVIGIACFTILSSVFIFILSLVYFSKVSIISQEFTTLYFIVFSFGCMLFSVNNIISAFLNGSKRLDFLFIFNLLLVFIQIISLYYFESLLGFSGLILSIPVTQILGFAIGLFLIYRVNFCSFLEIKEMLSSNVVYVSYSKYKGYIVMYVITAITVPLTQYISRHIVATNISIDSAGIWQAMIKLSEGYMAILSMMASVYLLPLFVRVTEKRERVRILGLTISLVVFLAIIASTIIGFFRVEIFSFIFTNALVPDVSTLIIFLVGDGIKAITWIFAIYFAVDGLAKQSILADGVLFGTLILAMQVLSVYVGTLSSASISYLVSSIIYFFLVVYLTRQFWKLREF